MTEALVEREDDNGIAILTLNRPKALNSLSPSLFVELRAHIENIAGSDRDWLCDSKRQRTVFFCRQ